MADAWTRVDEVLQAVLLRPPGERDTFLRQACAGDTALENEVRSLLAADEQAGSFLDAPAIHVAARAVADDQRAGETHRLETARMALSPGSRLGPYEIAALVRRESGDCRYGHGVRVRRHRRRKSFSHRHWSEKSAGNATDRGGQLGGRFEEVESRRASSDSSRSRM